MLKTSCQFRPVSGCPRPTVWNVDELPLCKVHRREYAESYLKYKRISTQAIRLGSQLYRKKLPKLRPESDIDQVLVDVRTFLGLIKVEMTLRRAHEQRFLLDPDEPHALWVERLETQEKTGKAFLAELNGVVTGRLGLRPAQESDFYASLAMNPLIPRATTSVPTIVRISGLLGAWFYTITLLAVFVVPRIQDTPTQCDSGMLHCCQTFKPVDDDSVSSPLDRPGIVVPGLIVGVGVTCAPIVVNSTVADAQSCDGIVSCCDNTVIGGLVHLDCLIIPDAV